MEVSPVFFLIDEHGESLGKFSSRDEAQAASEALREADAFAEFAVIETDANGKRVGEAVSLQYH
jgi:hypothetical protein